MNTDVTRRSGAHCPCCRDRIHPTDLACRHCGADLASGAHPRAKPKPRIGVRDEEELPHGFWPAITVALVLMTAAFFVFPPAAIALLAVAALWQVPHMPMRGRRG